jgi:hypothetical protein
MKTIQCTITGLRPLLMNNGEQADPINPLVVEKKKLTSKGSKKMTLADYEEIDRLSWLAAVYWSEENGLVIPSDNIEAMIVAGARKARKGKDALAAMFLSEAECVIEHPRKGQGIEKIMADKGYTLRKPVMQQKARIMRVRPRIQTWSTSFTVEYDESVINGRDLQTAITEAGAIVGIGDWRPKYGRFTAEFS